MKKILSILLVLAIVLTIIPLSVSANETDAAEPVQTAEVAADVLPAEEVPEAEPVLEPEEAKFDVDRVVDCVCGGWHNGENGHVCEAVTWTEVTMENRATYFNNVRRTEDINLRLAEDVTNNAVTLSIENCTVSIDLAGHSININTTSRFINMYLGSTLNICDSVGGGKIKLNQSGAVSSATMIAFFNTPTSEANSENCNIFGGTIEKTGTGTHEAPIIMQYPNYTHLAVYSGVTFKNSANSFTGTTNSKCGGFLMLNGANSTCYLGKCTIDSVSSGTAGGAIYMIQGKLTIDGTTFKNCSSKSTGGAIHFQAGRLSVANATFTNCSNNKAANGGAICINGASAKVTIDNTTFTGNSGKYGGAVFNGTARGLEITDCTFTGNQATAGGAVAAYATSSANGDASVTLTRCLLTGNVSANDGGACYVFNDSILNVVDTTITENHSTCASNKFQSSGIALRYTSTVNISGNSRVFNNTGSGSNTKNIDIIAEAENANDLVRTVNIGVLTGEAYVVVNPSKNSAGKEMVINADPANAVDTSQTGKQIYFVKHDTPLYEGDVEIMAETELPEYTGDSDVNIIVKARLTSQSDFSEAYIETFKASASSEHLTASEATLNTLAFKVTKDQWTTVGTLTATIQDLTATANGEEITVEAAITAEAEEAEEITASATASVDLIFDPNAHMHCICGSKDTCSFPDHESDVKIFKKLTSSNLSIFNGQTFVGPNRYCFYLEEDITVTTRINVGQKDGVATEIYLCLNGHTLTVTADRLFNMINGNVTVCDCVGGGIIQSNVAPANKPANGCIIFWQNKDNSTGHATYTMYGGTLQYADVANKISDYGLLCMQDNAVCNLYGVTVDGKNKGTNPGSAGGSGGISALGGVLTMKDCVIQNCTSNAKGTVSGKGGALYAMSGGSITIVDCKFENNHAEISGGAIYATGNNNLTLQGECLFIDNTAINDAASDIALASNRKLDISGATLEEKLNVSLENAGSFGKFTQADYQKLEVKAADGYEYSFVNGTLKAYIPSTEHPHCYCGGECTLGGHAHVENYQWQPCSSGATLAKAHTSEVWYYLTDDITVSGNVQIGNKSSEAEVHICLNGHTITVTNRRMFDVRYGIVTVCDCVGTGSIESKANETTNAGSIVMWLANTYSNPNATFELYGGTLTYADDSTQISSHGFVYMTNQGVLNVYGGTIDGKNRGTVATKDGAGSGGITIAGKSTVNFYGGTIQNCIAKYEDSPTDPTKKVGGSGGAILNNTNCTVNISGGEFLNNYAERYGGALYTSNKTSITGGVFEGNACEVRGGAILSATAAKELRVSNAIFKDNVSHDTYSSMNGEGGSGGAINANTHLYLNNCQFINNIAENKGGGAVAVYCQRNNTTKQLTLSPNLFINNCRFTGNVNGIQVDGTEGNPSYQKNKPYGAAGGGAIYLDAGYYTTDPYAQCSITNCTFDENQAPSNYGGAVMVRHAKVTLDNTEFVGNKANHGSAYACGRFAKNYFKNVKFYDNEATGMGAAILQADCTLEMDYGEFVGNYSKSSGGGLCLYNAGASVIKNGLFANNISGASGGAMYVRTKTVGTVIENVTCHDNIATNNGGAAYIYGELTVNNGDFYKNTAKKGGGVFSTGEQGILTILDGHYYQNTGIGHGGVAHVAGYMTINGGLFENNKATKNGGAFSNNGSGVYKTFTKLGKNAVIRNNTAGGNGGAVYTWRSYNLCEIDGAEIYGNKASGHGGAVYQSPETWLILRSGNIHDNECKENGGGIYGQGHVSLLGGTITGNKAGGMGGAVYLTNEVSDEESLQHNVFTLGPIKASGNKAGKGSELYLTDTAAAVIYESVLVGEADFILTVGGGRKLTKTLHGAYNYQDLGNNTFKISDASNAARPSEVDKNGVAHIVGDYVPVTIEIDTYDGTETKKNTSRGATDEDDAVEEETLAELEPAQIDTLEPDPIAAT